MDFVLLIVAPPSWFRYYLRQSWSSSSLACLMLRSSLSLQYAFNKQVYLMLRFHNLICVLVFWWYRSLSEFCILQFNISSSLFQPFLHYTCWEPTFLQHDGAHVAHLNDFVSCVLAVKATPSSYQNLRGSETSKRLSWPAFNMEFLR